MEEKTIENEVKEAPITETPTVEVEEVETVEEPKLKKFDPENPDFTFEDEQPEAEVEGEPLEKFDATTLGLEPEQVAEYQHLFDGLEEAGVTAEQMGKLFDMIGEMGSHELHKKLDNGLSNEEKKAWGDIRNFTQKSFEGTDVNTEELLEDPNTIKAIHHLMKGQETMVNTQPESTGASLDELKSQYSDFVHNESFDRQKRLDFIKDLISKASNKSEAEDYFADRM